MEDKIMTRRLRNMKNVKRKINTIKWMVSEAIRSRINGFLGFFGLFLTDNNRVSQVLGHSSMFDEDMLCQILGSDDPEPGMVLRDLKTRRIWILCGWDWEV